MQGALLRTGKSDDFIAMGETGQPVYKAALQIIAALTRKNPQLAQFLAIPKSNEQGSVIDWYSPLAGDVIPWTSATEDERNEARSQLNRFKTQIGEMSQTLVQSGDRSKQGDLVIFGKLLARVPNCPDDTYVYLVNGERTNAQGTLESYQQPVLSFWGFINCEDDRKREPLYFLTPRAPAQAAAVAQPATVPLAEPVAPAPLGVTERRSWWLRFWWVWPLLLLLLLLSLLRGCAPNAQLPGLPWSANTDRTGFSSSPTSLPSMNLPGMGSGDGGAAVPEDQPETGAPESQPQEAPDQAEPALAPEAEPGADEPQPAPQDSEPAPEQAPQPEQVADQPQPLSLPEDASEGDASFLNGHYRGGAGIQDRRTGKPLRLEYAFNDGQGSVTVRRPDGVDCTGAVAAAMNNGVLGINSQGQAKCTDGSHYDMPQVSCKAGAQSIADCSGNYGSDSFPMTMRKVGE